MKLFKTKYRVKYSLTHRSYFPQFKLWWFPFYLDFVNGAFESPCVNDETDAIEFIKQIQPKKVEV